MAASTRSPAEKQPSGRVLDKCAVPRGTVGRSRSSREAARATPQLAAAPVTPVAGEEGARATCICSFEPRPLSRAGCARVLR